MRKDAYTFSVVFFWAAMVSISAMIIFKLAESWSQNHFSDYDWVLNIALIGIGAVFIIRALEHPRKDNKTFGFFGVNVRNRHLNFWASVSFFLIAIFGVNSPLGWVSFLHLLVTGSGILAALLSSIFYYHKYSVEFWCAVVASVLGLGGFLYGYLTDVYSIAEGEGIVAFPVIIFLIFTTKIKK